MLYIICPSQFYPSLLPRPNYQLPPFSSLVNNVYNKNTTPPTDMHIECIYHLSLGLQFLLHNVYISMSPRTGIYFQDIT